MTRMETIRKKIIVDEDSRPVAVQIDYRDWIEIEQSLSPSKSGAAATNLARHIGAISLSEDPLAYQKRARGEWA